MRCLACRGCPADAADNLKDPSFSTGGELRVQEMYPCPEPAALRRGAARGSSYQPKDSSAKFNTQASVGFVDGNNFVVFSCEFLNGGLALRGLEQAHFIKIS